MPTPLRRGGISNRFSNQSRSDDTAQGVASLADFVIVRDDGVDLASSLFAGACVQWLGPSGPVGNAHRLDRSWRRSPAMRLRFGLLRSVNWGQRRLRQVDALKCAHRYFHSHTAQGPSATPVKPPRSPKWWHDRDRRRANVSSLAVGPGAII